MPTFEVDAFTIEMRDIHNEFRAKHHANPLKLDPDQCKAATEHAKKLMSKRKLEHTKNAPYGENVFMAMNTDQDKLLKNAARDACNLWYSEITKFVFGKEPDDANAGHFTQMVWKDTKFLGVGHAHNKSNAEVYVVCNYSPAGNIRGRFNDNVQIP